MERKEQLLRKLADREESLKTHQSALEYAITEDGKKAAARLIGTLEREIELIKKELKSETGPR